jgi:hypothetical protein
MALRTVFFRSLRTTILVGVMAGLVLADARALTVCDLLTEPELTPKKFAAKFERFEYDFDPLVQPPEIFLRREIGECDDYAVLADPILKQRGFQTRIIHIRLVGRVAHAVCYVDEAKAYLD